MTDNEIIKALRCCLNVDSKCADCHFIFERHFCKNALLKQTLDLINRLQTENNQPRVKLDDYERDIIPKLKYSLERANKYGAETEAENIRLLKENENLTSANENLTSDLTSAKAEIERLEIQVFIYSKTNYIKGIKDFAERLKERTISYVGVVEQQEVIDDLVKEMLGEQE